MKTKTFIEKVEALGYVVGNFLAYLSVSDSDGHDFAAVSKKHRFAMDTDTFHFAMHVNDEDAEKIATLLFEYSATPLADREEEKRYRLRLVSQLIKDQFVYLIRLPKTSEYTIGSKKVNNETWKTIFTESEIAEMDITGFEKEEVEG